VDNQFPGMNIIIDKRVPQLAKQALSEYGELVEFGTSGITYEAISCHPDIFFCQAKDGLIVAPNIPQEYLSILTLKGIPFSLGQLPVGNRYPDSARFNAVVTDQFLIHNRDIVDPAITKSGVQLEFNNVSQGYCRCNLIHLGENRFITSDRGIEKSLHAKNARIQYVSPAGIILPGFEHGFFGGCCGLWDHKLLLIGRLDLYPEGNKIRPFVEAASIEIVELYEGPLFDGGGLFFV
jgi:hypothetical protein